MQRKLTIHMISISFSDSNLDRSKCFHQFSLRSICGMHTCQGGQVFPVLIVCYGCAIRKNLAAITVSVARSVRLVFCAGKVLGWLLRVGPGFSNGYVRPKIPYGPSAITHISLVLLMMQHLLISPSS